jgi:hypothetical protein
MAPPALPDLKIVGRTAMALEAIAEAGVHLVLSGHFHHAFTADLASLHTAMRRSVLIVEAGTAISLRRRDEPNSYNLIEVVPGSLCCTVRAWDGETFANAATVAYDLVEGRWLQRREQALAR